MIRSLASGRLLKYKPLRFVINAFDGKTHITHNMILSCLH